ncbi:MAG: class I SAM-dependent methyltransferase [Bacillota bacterium]|nr:class I SAM-dependent methyltransferase [Bacillota bacterium]
MKALVSFVIEGEPVADVGTDHGFVPIDLLAKNKVPFAILTDINEGPLQKAQNNLNLIEISNDLYDIRLGSGLVPIKNGEVSSVIIAGMGGENIIDILAEDINKTKSFKRFILQPRKRSFMLREWLQNNGFEIKEEKIVKEAGKLCEVFYAEQGTKKDDIFLPVKMRKDPLFKEFLDDYIRKVNVVIDNMGNSEETKELVKSWIKRREDAERIKDEYSPS